MIDFEDRVILITGAASGIGLATAHLLASRGAKLSLADTNEAGLSSAAEAIKAQHGTQVEHRVVDVRSEEQIQAWVESAKASLGSIYGAANMAGVIGKSLLSSLFPSLVQDLYRGLGDAGLIDFQGRPSAYLPSQTRTSTSGTSSWTSISKA